jgi:hypothetical protein
MSVSPTAVRAVPSSGIVIGASDLLPRHAVFRTGDLDHARAHLCGVFAEHGVNYLPRERHLEFRHRQAKLGSIALNSLQWGAGVMVQAPLLPDFYLLQFTLAGECELWQGKHHSVLRARSVTIVNPGRAFRKAWTPRTHQLLLRIDRRLVERELRAWTDGNEGGSVEFDIPPIEDLATVGTLALYATHKLNVPRQSEYSAPFGSGAAVVSRGKIRFGKSDAPRVTLSCHLLALFVRCRIAAIR